MATVTEHLRSVVVEVNVQNGTRNIDNFQVSPRKDILRSETTSTTHCWHTKKDI